MKKSLVSTFVSILMLQSCCLLYSQINYQNQITIRSDRVFMLNGRPFFPIGICFENEQRYYQLKNSGFNFINLFTQNHFLYSDSCGFNSKNIISGDVTTSVQYQQMLGLYAPDMRWDSNARRIFNYFGNDNMYILGDDYTFFSDEMNDYVLNTFSCGDSIIFKKNFNQSVRNESVARLMEISHWQGNKLIGSYSKDDANLFAVDGPYPAYYYDNFFSTRVMNFKDTYDEFKKGYPNSIILMSIPNTYFPRAVDPVHWPNVDTAREHWIKDAKLLIQGADVLFCPGYLTYEFYSDAFMIYNNKLPSVYTYDLERTVFGRVLPPNKAVLGGLIFDIYESLPDTADPNALNKIKWHIYSGLQKGCTGLIFFGWQKYARPEGGISIAAWNNVRTIVNEMVNILHLNDRVFIYTNSGQVNHTVSGSYSGNVSYAVYKIAGWNDYYLLVTNNPNGSLFANEPDNTVTISGDPSVINWRKCSIKEEFTGQNIQLQPDLSIRYTMPCYATALFHVKVTEAPFYFYLFQNYPNPFNNTTKIIFELSESSFITINIYDVNGREVKKLLSGNFNAGRYEVEFNGSALASSVYFYELHANGSSRFRKMVLVK